MGGYAVNTRVSVANSKAEIENTLNRFGIVDIVMSSVKGIATIMFTWKDHPYRIDVFLPKQEDFRLTPERGWVRTPEKQYEAWEQACRVKWRELNLLLKAKLVAISNDAATFHDEFLAYAMLPNKQTVGQMSSVHLQKFAESGEMPPMLDFNPRGVR